MPSQNATFLSRVAPEQRQRLETAVPAAQSAALRAMLNDGLARSILPTDIKSALMAAGYVHETLGGVALTPIGQVRAMMENV